jgi:hypothetical protein
MLSSQTGRANIMPYLDLADQIIPGYKTLSENQRNIFENSESGKQLVKLVNDTSENFTKSQGWINFLFRSNEKEREQIKAQFALNKKNLLNNINKTREYQTVIVKIATYYLKMEYEDFNLLNKEKQKKLASSDFSQTLRLSLSQCNELIAAEFHEFTKLDEWTKMNSGHIWLNRIEELETKKKNAVHVWEETFLAENDDLEPFRKSIAEKKELIKKEKLAQEQRLLEQHLNELGSFLPMLHRRKPDEQLTFLAQLGARETYSLQTAQLDEKYISNLLLYLMQKANYVAMNFINLDAFNEEQARFMAQKILNTFNEQTNLKIEDWIEDYNNRLYHHLINELRLINGKKWQVKPPGATQVLMSSLSYLWNNPAVEHLNAYMTKLADAHAFIQATNFSTQNESSLLAILDIYNYGRYHEQISETRSIITNLLKSLQPIYDEYKQIAFYEKNIYLKTFRILMPIIIVVGVIVLVSAALTPLALPEIAFVAVFIPSLILGLALAAKYLSVKNDVYKYLRDKYYGGSFEIPEFQVNERMKTAFGHTNAVQISQLYIDTIKHCDTLEANYRFLHAQGSLTREQIKERNDNLVKRHQLYLEWYDLHDNKELGVDELTSIALTRLQKECDSQYQLLEIELTKEEQSIKESLDHVTSDIKTTILNNNETLNDKDQNDSTKTLIRTSYRHGLFTSPNTLSIKKHLEAMATLVSTDLNPQI